MFSQLTLPHWMQFWCICHLSSSFWNVCVYECVYWAITIMRCYIVAAANRVDMSLPIIWLAQHASCYDTSLNMERNVISDRLFCIWLYSSYQPARCTLTSPNKWSCPVLSYCVVFGAIVGARECWNVSVAVLFVFAVLTILTSPPCDLLFLTPYPLPPITDLLSWLQMTSVYSQTFKFLTFVTTSSRRFRRWCMSCLPFKPSICAVTRSRSCTQT